MTAKFVSSLMMIGDTEIYISGKASYSVDQRFGEDADGNRGVCVTTVEEISEIIATDLCGDEISLTNEELQKANDILTRKFFED